MEWWNRPPVVYAMERVCRTWPERGNPSIQIGDMTRPQGGDYWRIPPEDEELTETEEGWIAVEISDEIVVTTNSGVRLTDHGGHDEGLVADIRPMVTQDGLEGQPLGVGDDLYSETHSRLFLEIVEQASPKNQGEYMLEFVLFGDSSLRGEYAHYSFDEDHKDHYHIKVK